MKAQGKDQEESMKIRQALMEIEHENRMRDSIIQDLRDKKQNKMSEVLSNIEENRNKALAFQRKRIKHIVHTFVHKQVVGQEGRIKLHKDKVAAFEKKRKEYQERVKMAAEKKVLEDKEKAKKNKKFQQKYNKKIQDIEEKKEEEARLLEEKAMQRQQKIESVLQNHEEEMDFFVGIIYS